MVRRQGTGQEVSGDWTLASAQPGDHGTVAWVFRASGSSSVTLVMGLDDLAAPSTSNVRCW